MTISKIGIASYGTTNLCVGDNASVLSVSVNSFGSLTASILHDESGGRRNTLSTVVHEEYATIPDNPGRFVAEVECQGRSLYVFEATKEAT